MKRKNVDLANSQSETLPDNKYAYMEKSGVSRLIEVFRYTPRFKRVVRTQDWIYGQQVTASGDKQTEVVMERFAHGKDVLIWANDSLADRWVCE